jgi:hypothetical protein
MAKIVLTNAVVKINGTDFSTNVNQIELSLTADEIDTTAFGTTGWRTVTGGLKSGSVTLSLHNDYAAAAIDSTLFGLFNTSATFVVIPNGTAVTSSNPSYSFEALVNSLQPVSGAVGDLAVQSLTLPINGPVLRGTTV